MAGYGAVGRDGKDEEKAEPINSVGDALWKEYLF